MARANKNEQRKQRRQNRPFPSNNFSEVYEFAKSMFEFGSGDPIKRISFFNHLSRSPESSGGRELITSANKYGVIEGGYQAATLKFTEIGRTLFSDESDDATKFRNRLTLSIQTIEPFNRLDTSNNHDFWRGLIAFFAMRAAVCPARRAFGV